MYFIKKMKFKCGNSRLSSDNFLNKSEVKNLREYSVFWGWYSLGNQPQIMNNPENFQSNVNLDSNSHSHLQNWLNKINKIQ